MDLYVYYRAQPAEAAGVQAQVESMQGLLRDRWGVRCGLKQRPRVNQERDTWMEIYLAVPADFKATLDAAVAASPLRLLIEGDRHVESFLECLPCA
ncbi:MAG: DUF4936 family protein [Herminiimonas sp.]|nr:DUF4936 family protein [Herminiimonas sp.]